MIHYTCTLCHAEFKTDAVMYTCPHCGEAGILDVVYDYKAIRPILNKGTLAQNHDISMWRYGPLLPVKLDSVSRMLRIGGTPLYRSYRLGKEIGLDTLYIKDEGLNPSGSTKDRASGVAVMKALEIGATTIACSSTGNAASSLACHAAHMGLQSIIFVPKRAPIGKLTQLSIYGAHVLMVDGDYHDAFRLSKDAIAKYGWYNRNAAINPLLVEGKKTVALEICEQLDFKPTDWIAISVGDGCSIAGVYKGLYDFKQLGLIDRIPKLLGVQSQGCAPFVIASKTKRPLVKAEENTLADSIAVGVPRNPIKAMRAVEASKGAWIDVPDEDILNAMSYLGRTEGIFGEPAGVTSLAGVIEALRQGVIRHDESVTVIMTGNGLKDPANAQKTGRDRQLIKPNIDEVEQYIRKNGVK
jgi:threonine synthase